MEMLDPCDLTEAVDFVLRGTDDTNVVVSPVVWRPSTKSGREWYFVVAASEPGRGFRCDMFLGPNKETATSSRSALFAAFLEKGPLVVHDMDDELAWARLCETLWPGERITGIRKQIEADRAH
jgi:hypothetical protein